MGCNNTKQVGIVECTNINDEAYIFEKNESSFSSSDSNIVRNNNNIDYELYNLGSIYNNETYSSPARKLTLSLSSNSINSLKK
jgi:hypothetical protein